jgi:hypothetical protein
MLARISSNCILTGAICTAERFELTLEQWKSRPWYNKVSEHILAPLRFMM